MTVQNPFVQPRGSGQDRRHRIREAMEEFAVTEGDHITYLNVFNSFESADGSAEWCEENCLNYRALVRAKEIRQQLARYSRTVWPAGRATPQFRYFNTFGTKVSSGAVHV